MAYGASGLSRMASGGGYAVWMYVTADAIATVNTAAYFTGEAIDMLNVGDVIWVYDTNVPTLSIVQVLSNSGTAVDVSDGTTIAQTDTD